MARNREPSSTKPPPSKKPAKPIADKRERIMRAAIKVFAKNGFYATRVSEIAKAAGVADGTIYLYFKNKDDVLIRIFEDRMGKLLDALDSTIESADNPADRVRAVVELQLGLLEERRELAEVITVNLRQSSRLLKQYAAPLFTKYLDTIASVISQGQDEGAFRSDINPKIAARALWGGLDGIALTWALSDGTAANLRKAARQFAMLYLDGLRPSVSTDTAG